MTVQTENLHHIPVLSTEQSSHHHYVFKHAQHTFTALHQLNRGNSCFCKLGVVINAAQGLDSNCSNYTCPGDSSTFCCSDTHLLVYNAGGIVKVSHLVSYN